MFRKVLWKVAAVLSVLIGFGIIVFAGLSFDSRGHLEIFSTQIVTWEPGFVPTFVACGLMIVGFAFLILANYLWPSEDRRRPA